VVLLMLLASALFVAAGVLDGAYPGGPAWSLTDPSAISHVFAIANTFVAVLVARGSERSLALRIGLSLFFVVERPASGFLIADKSALSVVVHIATAIVELVIFVSALRVWRLGHSIGSGDMEQLFSVDETTPEPPPASAAEDPAPRAATGALATRSAWLIGVTSGVLAAVLVTDGVVSGFMPGGRDWGFAGESSGWLVYLFAAVVVTVAIRALKGGRLALRLLGVTALIFFLERAFSPFALRVTDPAALALHGIAAFVAIAVALTAANAIRESTRPGDVGSLEAA
jgi:hypothetical protein